MPFQLRLLVALLALLALLAARHLHRLQQANAAGARPLAPASVPVAERTSGGRPGSVPTSWPL